MAAAPDPAQNRGGINAWNQVNWGRYIVISPMVSERLHSVKGGISDVRVLSAR